MAIEVNGMTYDSWDDVPEEIRTLTAGLLPDSDGNGVPDLFEGKGPVPEGTHTFTGTSIEVGGKTYQAMSEVPAELQATIGQLLRSEVVRDGKDRRIVAVAATPTPERPASTPAPAEGQVVLNGVTVDVGAATGPTPKRRWWSRKG